MWLLPPRKRGSAVVMGANKEFRKQIIWAGILDFSLEKLNKNIKL